MRGVEREGKKRRGNRADAGEKRRDGGGSNGVNEKIRQAEEREEILGDCRGIGPYTGSFAAERLQRDVESGASKRKPEYTRSIAPRESGRGREHCRIKIPFVWRACACGAVRVGFDYGGPPLVVLPFLSLSLSSWPRCRGSEHTRAELPLREFKSSEGV